MPGKKVTKPRDKKIASELVVPEPTPEQDHPRQQRGKGLSGQGAGSALAELLEQEKVRTRRPDPS